MYQVLARKYRPQSFDEVIGQEVVVQTLQNAIRHNRIHSAYLFAGARGIGKTSLARLFAKSLNCENGPTPKPCQKCVQCQEITSGTSLDVQEIDGASHTSVDNIREIRDQLKYLPVSGKYKIYIIDEVHMLSSSAFNALLKTLEEPPPRVIFLFATTESHKIPATILSRCQRFDLRRISVDLLFKQLEKICLEEKVNPEKESLEWIVKEAEGSLRDAQSLLDQGIALTEGKLQLDAILSMLGLADRQFIVSLTEAVLKGETALALQIVREVYNRGHDLRQLLHQWGEFWADLLVYRATSSDSKPSSFEKLASLTGLNQLDLGFHLLNKGMFDLQRTEWEKPFLDVLVVKLCHLSEMKEIESILKSLQNSPVKKEERKTLEQTAPAQINNPTPVLRDKKTENPKSSDLFIEQLKENKPHLSPLLQQVKKTEWEGERLIWKVESEGFLKDSLVERKGQIEELAQKYFEKLVEIDIRSETRSGSKENIKNTKTDFDSLVASAIEILDGKEVNE